MMVQTPEDPLNLRTTSGIGLPTTFLAGFSPVLQIRWSVRDTWMRLPSTVDHARNN